MTTVFQWDNTTPDYSIPTKTFVVGESYEAWTAYE